MINLSKKQVGALLKVLSNDTTRAALTELNIKDGYARATNGYILAKLKTTLPDGAVSREELTKWYKLAGNKDRLTDEILAEMRIEIGWRYPEVDRLITENQTTAIDNIAFDTKYATYLQDLAGEPLRYELTGTASPMIATLDDNTYVLMPVRR